MLYRLEIDSLYVMKLKYSLRIHKCLIFGSILSHKRQKPLPQIVFLQVQFFSSSSSSFFPCRLWSMSRVLQRKNLNLSSGFQKIHMSFYQKYLRKLGWRIKQKRYVNGCMNDFSCFTCSLCRQLLALLIIL